MRSDSDTEKISEAVEKHERWAKGDGTAYPRKFHAGALTKTLASKELLRGFRFSGRDLHTADFIQADISYCLFQGADLHRGLFTHTKCQSTVFDGANLRGASFSYANLECARFKGADLTDVSFNNANLRNVDLSGAKGLQSPWEWLQQNFEQIKDGFIVYKRLENTGQWMAYTQYRPPSYWKIEEGAELREECNPNRTVKCACGVNFGTLAWCSKNYIGADLWQCLLPWEGVATLTVPYGTDGKARTGCLKLIQRGRSCFRQFVPYKEDES